MGVCSTKKMRDYSRRIGDSPTRIRVLQVAILLWALSPLEAVPHDSNRYSLSVCRPHDSQGHPDAMITLRGGERTHDDDDEDEKTPFWSLGALFRLNADAKNDASLPDSDEDRSKPLHLQRGNGRGGALAIHSANSKRFVDGTIVSRGWMVAGEVQADDDDDDDIEQTEPAEADTDKEESEDLKTLDGEESEGEVEELEGSDTLEEEETSLSDRFTDTAPVTTATSQFVEDEDEDTETESDEEQADDSETLVSEMQESMDVLPTEAAVDAARELELPAIDAAEEVESDTRENIFSLPARAKGMLQDAAKLWWTKVWTETEDVPDLEDVVCDESDTEISVSVVDNKDIIQEKAESEEEYDEEDETIGKVKASIFEEIQDDDLETEDRGTGVRDELATMRPIEKKAQMKETPELETGSVAADRLGPGLQASLEAESTNVLISDSVATLESRVEEESPYTSSGYWGTIDKVVSLGLSDVNPHWKLSRHMRAVRKSTARVTGLHGFLSRKGRILGTFPENAFIPPGDTDSVNLNDEDLGLIRRQIAAIEIAKQNVARRALEKTEVEVRTRRGIWQRQRKVPRDVEDAAPPTMDNEAEIASVFLTLERKSLEEQLDYERRKERVKEIDRLISKGQLELLNLQCEKDALQRRPNPLYNYTTTTEDSTETQRISRKFNFPPQELVDEYIDELFANRRLEKMNHTDLWQNGAGFDDDEDESIGDDLLTPSADARKLYEPRQRDRPSRGPESRSSNGNGGGGSWLLRQNLGKGGSLGEKIGEATETAAYKAVCTSVMSVLARSIAAIHGVNIMTHSDIRLYMEQSPDLPPVGKNVIPGSDAANNYAQEAIMDAMRKGVRRHKKRGSRSRRQRAGEAFLQRDAVVETLISHCQISAPLLKLFPLAWQRALLGNIISLIAAIVSDFCDGIQLQILGHQMSFSFKPITESDMIRHIGMAGNGFNHRRTRPVQFEAAIRATAEDVSENLQFLDRWHHRALGSGMLRAQIANLIARIVLTLADEVLSSARIDLWSAQAGGPRMLAGLEYRTTPGSMD